MNTVIKHIVANTCKPLLARYLAKTRTYRYKKLKLQIAPGVFHPGFFFSTRLLLQYISKIPLQQKQFLELGCGSGLISMVAAGKGAHVTATDINPVAVEFLEKNCRLNGIQMQVIFSDLFNIIPQKKFDIIAINPPYYKKDPVSVADHAWYCGQNGAYFERLFQGLATYMHAGSQILMVLFDGCDMNMIGQYASRNNFTLHRVVSKQNLLEKNFICQIKQNR